MNSELRRRELKEAIRYITGIINDRSDLSHDYAMNFIASDPATPSMVLRCMANEINNPEVLEHIAGNQSTPEEVLCQLALHENKDVRLAVAGNHNASHLAVRPLTMDNSPTVRFTLAENPYTEGFVLEKLAEDDNPFVAHRAMETIDKVKSEVV